jgi:hydrogenase large subunit
MDRGRDVPRLRDHPARQGPAGRPGRDPRICGICGGSHLYKSAYALDTAWRTHVPPNATLIRNICQACETLQSIPRYFYALFAIDLTNKNYAKSKMYDEAVRRFAPYVGTVTRRALCSQQARRGLRHLRRAVAALEFHGARRCDVRADLVGRHPLDRDPRALEGQLARGQWLGCSIDRWLENKTWEDVLAWVDENEAQHNSDCGFFIRYCLDIGLDKYGQGWATTSRPAPTSTRRCTRTRPSRAATAR